MKHLHQSGLRAGALSAGTTLLGGTVSLAVVSATAAAPARPASVVFILAGTMTCLAAMGTGMRAYLQAASHARWLDSQLQEGSTQAGATSPSSHVIAGLQARARAAETAAGEAMVFAQQAAAGMATASNAAVDAEESVRAHLVAELHDSVAQHLVLAGMMEWDDDAGKEEVLRHTRAGEKALRDIMAAQRPPELENTSLAAAISNLAADFHARWGLLVNVDWPSASTPIPYSHAVTVYRFIQEGLSNVAKHAQVPSADVTFSASERAITVVVSDHGNGFDPEDRNPLARVSGRHIGLDMMRRRVRMLNGTVTVSSAPHRGTTLRLVLPVPDSGRR